MEKITINGVTLGVSETAETVVNYNGSSWEVYKATSDPSIQYHAEYRDYNLYSEEFIKREA